MTFPPADSCSNMTRISYVFLNSGTCFSSGFCFFRKKEIWTEFQMYHTAFNINSVDETTHTVGFVVSSSRWTVVILHSEDRSCGQKTLIVDDITAGLLSFLEESSLLTAKLLDCPVFLLLYPVIHTRNNRGSLVPVLEFQRQAGRTKPAITSHDCCCITSTLADACQMVIVVLRASDNPGS